jgi:S-DNA-T family DNA segregation ATPase FtsK/SpoIIIE
MAEQGSKTSMLSSTPWFKKHISAAKIKDGIWVGNGFTNQYQMEASKMTPDLKEDMPPGFGYVLRKGKITKVKLLGQGADEEDNE